MFSSITNVAHQLALADQDDLRIRSGRRHIDEALPHPAQAGNLFTATAQLIVTAYGLRIALRAADYRGFVWILTLKQTAAAVATGMADRLPAGTHTAFLAARNWSSGFWRKIDQVQLHRRTLGAEIQPKTQDLASVLRVEILASSREETRSKRRTSSR